jgi:hypothetical protein
MRPSNNLPGATYQPSSRTGVGANMIQY